MEILSTYAGLYLNQVFKNKFPEMSNTLENMLIFKHKLGRFIIIIIIIKRGWQCKAGRERLTPYQSEDPTPQHQHIERKKRKGKQ